MYTLKGQKIAVSGGAGFIGSHLVRELLARGASQVTIIDSLRYGDVRNINDSGAHSNDPRVKLVQFTLGRDNPAELDSILEGSAFLFHLAAEKHNQSKDAPQDVIRANINGTLELYLSAARVGVKKLVYTSSLYAYGRMEGDPFVETEVPAPQTVYGITKLAGEHLAEYVFKQHGLSYNVLRYLFVYGPRQFAGMGYKSVIVKNFERMLQGQAPVVFGSGTQSLDYVFVDDAVDATIRALETQKSREVFNVGSGQAVSVKKLLTLMQAIAGNTLAPINEAADWTEGSTRVADVRKAREVLGWSAQVALEQGLRRTFEWMKSCA